MRNNFFGCSIFHGGRRFFLGGRSPTRVTPGYGSDTNIKNSPKLLEFENKNVADLFLTFVDVFVIITDSIFVSSQIYTIKLNCLFQKMIRLSLNGRVAMKKSEYRTRIA